MSVAGPGRRELRARGDQQQHGQGLHPFDGALEELGRCRVEPLAVLQHHEHRLVSGKTAQADPAGPQSSVPLALRRHVQRRIAPPRRDGEQCREQRRHLGRVVCGLAQQRLQLVELALGRIVGLEGRRSFQLLDDWMKRAVHMVGRTIVPKPRVRLVGQPLEQGVHRRDLPMPGSPDSSTICPSPSLACSKRSSSMPSSCSRPMKA